MDLSEFSNFLALDTATLYDTDNLQLKKTTEAHSCDPTLVQTQASPVAHDDDDLNVDLAFTDLDNFLENPSGTKYDLSDSMLLELGQTDLVPLGEQPFSSYSAQMNLMVPVKQEAVEMEDYRPPSYPGYESSSPGYTLPSSSVMASGTSSKDSSIASPAPSRKSKTFDKNSDDYRRRRERNNIAVRKSREKAKYRSQATEQLVDTLQKENESLQKRVSELDHEVQALHSCFEALLPDNLKKQIAQSLQSIRNRHKHLL